MEIKVVYKRKSRRGLFAGIFSLPILIGIIIFSVAFTSDDDLLVINQQSASIEDILLGLVEDREQQADNEKNGSSSITTGNNGAATTGKGLNLLLINDIKTESFVKEYLSICAENQNGTLGANSNEYDSYATTQISIGINVSETGFYPAGDGKTLPNTDLPKDSNGAPKWDGKTYSLKNWCKTSSTHNTGIGGPLAYTPGETAWTYIEKKSKYNKGTSTNGNGGDGYLFPDAVYGLNDYLKKAIGSEGFAFKDASILAQEDNANSIATVLAHNRGANGMKMLVGIPYDVCYAGHTSNYVDLSKMKDEEKVSILNDVYDTVSDGVECNTIFELIDYNSSVRGYWISLFTFVKNGWYFSPMAASNVKQRGGNTNGIKMWNLVFEDEQVSTVSEFNAAVDNHTAKLSTKLGISDSECDKIYGTKKGQYNSYFSYMYGHIFYVTNKSSNVYKNASNAKLVYCLEAMTADHIFSGVIAAPFIYAKMLAYAGVGVDPTNPSTYMGQYVNSDEWIPSGGNLEISGDLYTALVAKGLDTTKLTEQRLAVILQGAKLCASGNVSYHRCRVEGCPCGFNCDGKCYNYKEGIPTHLDCSATVYWCYLTGINESEMPRNTRSYANSSKVTNIGTDWSKAKPGDIAWRSGHVQLIIGVNGQTIYTIESSSHGTVVSYSNMTVDYANSNGYSIYRYTKF